MVTRYIVALGFAVSLAIGAPTADTIAVCNAIYARYPKYVAFDPLGPQGWQTLDDIHLYQDTLTDYWNQDNADFRPACMFFPSSADEISFAVKTLNKYSSVPFGLKSGGHNPNKGFSSVDGGVLISFRPNLASTSISADRSTADVGPGSRWSEVILALEPYGKAVVGGRLGHVGVGGYMLGGGLSFLTGQYGFSCDTVTNFELVLADGTVTNANATSETDLFYALKGGGNQFGIVTKFTMKTIPMGSVWGGTRIYDSPKYRSEILSATAKFTEAFADPKAAVIVTFDYSLANLVNIVVLFYFYDGPSPPAGVFDDFFAIPSISDETKTRKFPDLLIANSVFSLQGYRYQIREATYPNLHHDNMTAFYEHYWQTYADFSLQQSLTNLDIQILSFAIQPIPAGLQKASNDAGGNTMGLNPAHGDLIFMEHDISWASPVCDDACPARLRDLVDGIEDHHKRTYPGEKPTHYQRGDVDFITHNPIFMNDGQTGQNVLQSYGAETYARMKEIQRRRDPNGFFSQRQGGFKFNT